MIREIKSNKGYVFATKDKSEVYDNILVLGIYDQEDNYIQIPIEEAEEIKKALEEKNFKKIWKNTCNKKIKGVY